ncbi:MAG: hypothetical protein ACYTHJ_10190 [Planctomycetota bacterium]|jgi:hypothetical protein
MKNRSRRALGCAVIALGTLAIQLTRATTIIKMSLDSLADHAVVAVTGTITQVETYWAQGPRRIESRITLGNIEYLKQTSRAPADQLEFTVPGGTMGTMQMRIAGSPEFAIGQRWFLMLQSTYKTHPVIGLNQGAFRLQADDQGVMRVADSYDNPVIAITENGMIRNQPRHHMANSRAAQHLRDQVNARLAGAAGHTDIDSTEFGMTWAAFSSAIQPILDGSRRFEDNAPIAARIPVTYTPTTLKPARNASSAAPDLLRGKP